MELGQLLKQARLEAGLSQRQLCGEAITRNMLSQIENGSAHPSMETLRYLAGQLGKPVSFFLEENAPSPSQSCLTGGRNLWIAGQYADALQILKDYPSDGFSDGEAGLLQVLCSLSLAEEAIREGRLPYALTLLQQAEVFGMQTPYYTPELKRRRLLLLAQAAPETDSALVSQLPDDELLLRARVAISQEDHRYAAALLDVAADHESETWCILRGDVCFALGEYAGAVQYYLKAESLCLHKLELCYEKLEDYKLAYHYARKQREQNKT